MRVMNQYLLQAWSFRGPARNRYMLLNTGTEEIGHIEMLACAVAMNLEGAPADLRESIAEKDGAVGATMAGEMPRHILSSDLNAMPLDSNASLQRCEGGGRLLATRLYEITDDPGMKDMLSFLIAPARRMLGRGGRRFLWPRLRVPRGSCRATSRVSAGRRGARPAPAGRTAIPRS